MGHALKLKLARFAQRAKGEHATNTDIGFWMWVGIICAIIAGLVLPH